MLSKFAKFLLVSTACAPVLFTYAFLEYLQKGVSSTFISLIVATVLLTLICYFVIVAAKTQLGRISFTVSQVKSADSETVGFVLVYLLPLINTTDVAINTPVLIFVLCLFGVVVWTTNAYHFNPLLGLFGFHFYEATSSQNVVFLLISQRDIRRTKQISEVVQLTEYIVLDTKKE